MRGSPTLKDRPADPLLQLIDINRASPASAPFPCQPDGEPGRGSRAGRENGAGKSRENSRRGGETRPGTIGSRRPPHARKSPVAEFRNRLVHQELNLRQSRCWRECADRAPCRPALKLVDCRTTKRIVAPLLKDWTSTSRSTIWFPTFLPSAGWRRQGPSTPASSLWMSRPRASRPPNRSADAGHRRAQGRWRVDHLYHSPAERGETAPTVWSSSATGRSSANWLASRSIATPRSALRSGETSSRSTSRPNHRPANVLRFGLTNPFAPAHATSLPCQRRRSSRHRRPGRFRADQNDSRLDRSGSRTPARNLAARTAAESPVSGRIACCRHRSGARGPQAQRSRA